MTTVKQSPESTEGSASSASSTIDVINPATGQIVGNVPDLGPAEVQALAERGRAVQPAWEALGFEGRGKILLRAQKWIIDHKEEVIETIVSETGKTYEDAQLAEISYGASAFGFWAKHAPEYLADVKVKSGSLMVKGKKLMVSYRPLGLIGIIGPWNYPLTNSFGDCIPAMAAGNSVILKPSEVTPLTSLIMARCLDECGMPAGVFQVATGPGDFFEPTVLVDVDHSMTAMNEETFGPTLPIMKVEDAEEAIRLANDSEFGLGASVFTRDVARGEEIAKRVHAGAVCVNDAMLNYVALELPMGGAKTSGIGSRHGAGGIRKFCQQQSILVSRLHPKRDVHMFPYTEKTTNRLGKLFTFLYGRGNRD